MDIKQYIVETTKEYYLRLKTIVPLDDAAMDKIEKTVAGPAARYFTSQQDNHAAPAIGFPQCKRPSRFTLLI